MVAGLHERLPGLPPSLKGPLHDLVHSVTFELLSLAVVVANAIVLGFERADASPALVSSLVACNYALTALFAVDVLLRWAAEGAPYLAVPSNLIELAILSVSIVDVLAYATGAVNINPSLKTLRVARAFRILRVARLSNAWMEVGCD